MNEFENWIAGLETQHLADLRFAEVSRALRALSSTYVERRSRLSRGAALAGAGKRAAFALFYGPLHYLLVREIVSAVPGATRGMPDTLIDLGCGTGAAGAAWAASCARPPRLVGIDRHPWATQEAGRTYRALGLRGRTETVDVTRARLLRLPGTRAAFLAAFTLNELAEEDRDRLLERLMDRVSRGDRVLVVEPLSGAVAPWWGRWQAVIEAAGGRADTWRFRVALPAIVEKLDRAAGLNHHELTGRSLCLGA